MIDLLSLSGDKDFDTRAMASLLHPQMHSLGAPGVAPARRYGNREEFLEYFPDARRQGIHVVPDVSEIKVMRSGSVLATGRLLVSTPAVTDTIAAWFVYTFRDGLIASLGTFLDHGLAKDSAGE